MVLWGQGEEALDEHSCKRRAQSRCMVPGGSTSVERRKRLVLLAQGLLMHTTLPETKEKKICFILNSRVLILSNQIYFIQYTQYTCIFNEDIMLAATTVLLY